MAEIVKYRVEEVDVNDESTSDEDIARKISADIEQSKNAWQTLKSKFTDYYFDFLSYKEAISDITKSNTFIPLPYVAVRANKSRLNASILASEPYGKVLPDPFDADLSWRLSLLYTKQLDEARYRLFVDQMLLDALIYGSAVFQVTHEQISKPMPSFYEGTSIPQFDEEGKRVWTEQVIKDGIALSNIHIQHFFLPGRCISAETAEWNAILHQKSISELKRMDGFKNLDKLLEYSRTEKSDSEKARLEQAHRKSGGQSLPYGTFEIIEYVTDGWVFHMPVGCDFLIYRDRNPYRRKPFHLARLIPLTNEPYGLSPLGAGHLMSHTINDIADVIMDELNLTNNKMWISNQDLVNDFELRSGQNNIIHVHGLDAGVPVSNAVMAVETRAIAVEVLQLLQWYDRIHQKVSGGMDTMVGIPALGAETAFENALMTQGPLANIEDMLQKLNDTFAQPLFEDVEHLNNLYFNTPKKIQQFGSNGELTSEVEVSPMEVYGRHSFRFEWVGKERSRVEERAQLIQALSVLGNMQNINEVTAPIIENLLIISGIRDVDRIKKALDSVIQMQKQIQMAQVMSAQKGGEEVPEDNLQKQIGDLLGQSVNPVTLPG